MLLKEYIGVWLTSTIGLGTKTGLIIRDGNLLAACFLAGNYLLWLPNYGGAGITAFHYRIC
jgi:hypothetical protein